MAGNRELIDIGSDERYVSRDQQGHFKESDDVGLSLVARHLRAVFRPRADLVVRALDLNAAVRPTIRH